MTEEARRKAPVVRLSEIKTKSDQRHRRQIKAEIAEIAKMTDDFDYIAYTIVAWDSEGNTHAHWNTDKLGNQGVLGPLRGELSKRAIERREAILDAQIAIVDDGE